MAAIDTPRTALGSAPVANRVFAFAYSVIGAVAAWKDARVTRNALNHLTDRELEDIGLTRGDIDLIATPRR